MKRPIIEINREFCNGCGLCTTACAEGALVLDDEDKAVLVKEIYCDGLGACLDVCPTGALKVIEREANAYDPAETYEYVKNTRGDSAAKHVHGIEDPGCGGGCPGLRIKDLGAEKAERAETNSAAEHSRESELSNWPIQLKLVSPAAPYFRESDLLIAADCTAFSLGRFHGDLLKGKQLIIACPKLDDVSGYVEKLAAIMRENTIYSITVVIMTVPCCSGMMRIVEEAVLESGKNIAVRRIVISPEGQIVS